MPFRKGLEAAGLHLEVLRGGLGEVHCIVAAAVAVVIVAVHRIVLTGDFCVFVSVL